MTTYGPNRLGEYLRARRNLLTPEDVGLTHGGRRRVPGLRREELAMLAGISPDYYLRLEQGRDIRPSERVLDALAAALRLDSDATRYLYQLGRPAHSTLVPTETEQVPPGLSRLVGSVSDIPVYVLGRLRDVLLMNPLARALIPILRPGTNQVRAMFLDPAARQLYPEWEAMAEGALAGLRAANDPTVRDPALDALVEELSTSSRDFRRLWARHEARLSPSDVAQFEHPQVGALTLRYELLALVGSAGYVVILYHAEPGSSSEEALTRLKDMAERDL